MSPRCTSSKDKLHGETARGMGFACGNGLQTQHTSHCNATSVQRDHFNSLPPQPAHFHQIIMQHVWLKTPFAKLGRHVTDRAAFQINCMSFICLLQYIVNAKKMSFFFVNGNYFIVILSLNFTKLERFVEFFKQLTQQSCTMCNQLCPM